MKQEDLIASIVEDIFHLENELAIQRERLRSLYESTED